MPALISVEAADHRLRLLPYRWYFALVRRGTGL
jgi:hypothetical protein